MTELERLEQIDTNEYLETLSTEELQELLSETNQSISYLDTYQMALKILMNSLYGALANKYFPLFNDKIAAAITGNGRYFIRGLGHHISEILHSVVGQEYNSWVYTDTDSCMFGVNPLVQKYQEKHPDADVSELTDFCQQIEDSLLTPKTQEFIDAYAYELNAYDKSMIGASREVVADCVAPSTMVRVKMGNENQILKISNLAKKFGINTLTKNNEFREVEGVEILSYNVETNTYELKPILNIQKKVTTKRMLTLTAPNGRNITVTEDHRIAIKTEEGVIYKEAKEITLDDDVMMFNDTVYNRRNCELYGEEYVNYGSTRCDLEAKGKAISKSLGEKWEEVSAQRLREQISRVKQLEVKYADRWVELIRKFMFMKRYTRYKTREQVQDFIIKHSLFYNLDRDVLYSLIRIYDKEELYRLLKRKKYGETYFYKLQKTQERTNQYRKFEGRVSVVQGKIRRAEGKTPLHTAKRKYRNEVTRITRNNIKKHGLENYHLIDKYTYNVDHIVPIMYGFRNDITQELIGNIRNLRVIRKLENIKKRCNIDYEQVDTELFEGYL